VTSITVRAVKLRYWTNKTNDLALPLASSSPYQVKPKFYKFTSRLGTTRLTCRDDGVEPCCSTQPKCMGSTRRTCHVVSRRDKPIGIWSLPMSLVVVDHPFDELFM